MTTQPLLAYSLALSQVRQVVMFIQTLTIIGRDLLPPPSATTWNQHLTYCHNMEPASHLQDAFEISEAEPTDVTLIQFIDCKEEKVRRKPTENTDMSIATKAR